MFDDIGLGINLGKCAACHIKRGKYYKDADLPIGDDQIIKVLEKGDKYRFLGKAENCNQLDSLVYEETRREYLRRLPVIWTSPLTIPRKIQATDVFANTMMEYYMTTSDWRIADMRELDRRSREIFTANGARHIAESTVLMYIPIEDGGKGFKSIEDTYKIAKIKAAHHINTSDDPRVKLVKTFQKQKEKNMRSMFVCANTFSGDLGLECEFEENKTILKTDHRNMEFRSTEFKQINAALYKALTANKKLEVINQPWLGYYTTKIWESSEISPVSKRIHSTWKNIPDVVKSINDSIKQQLIKTKVYMKNKLMQEVADTSCRLYHQAEETMNHIMCSCPAIAQDLYKERHDCMLRPIYYSMLRKYRFDESKSRKPWFEQSEPQPVREKEHIKVLWDIPHYVDKRPTDNAIKPDITIVNHYQKEVTLIEGTVCSVGMIKQREERKTQKYEELRTELHKIYKDYKVKQINIVMDFLANFGKTLPNELKSLGIDSKEILLVLQQSQKWIMTKNCNIVKRIYE